MGKWQTKFNITNKSQEVSPFPAGDHKAAMDRRKSIEGLNRFHSANLTLSSDVDEHT